MVVVGYNCIQIAFFDDKPEHGSTNKLQLISTIISNAVVTYKAKSFHLQRDNCDKIKTKSVRYR